MMIDDYKELIFKIYSRIYSCYYNNLFNRNMSTLSIDSGAATIKTFVYYNKEVLKFKFPPNHKISHIEEYLKRKLKINATDAVYTFDKHRHSLINAMETI